MARITVEDCVPVVPNRFELVVLAAHRARELSSGMSKPVVIIDRDTNTVLALRELASGRLDVEALRNRYRNLGQLIDDDELPEDPLSTDYGDVVNTLLESASVANSLMNRSDES